GGLRLRRRLLGLGLRRGAIAGCGRGRGPAILGGVLACFRLCFWHGIIGGRCSRRRRYAVLAVIFGGILCRRRLGLGGGLLLLRLRFGRRLRAWRWRLGAGVDEGGIAHLDLFGRSHLGFP